VQINETVQNQHSFKGWMRFLSPNQQQHWTIPVQACLAYLQRDAHWYSTLPLSSSYSLLSRTCS